MKKEHARLAGTVGLIQPQGFRTLCPNVSAVQRGLFVQANSFSLEEMATGYSRVQVLICTSCKKRLQPFGDGIPRMFTTLDWLSAPYGETTPAIIAGRLQRGFATGNPSELATAESPAELPQKTAIDKPENEDKTKHDERDTRSETMNVFFFCGDSKCEKSYAQHVCVNFQTCRFQPSFIINKKSQEESNGVDAELEFWIYDPDHASP